MIRDTSDDELYRWKDGIFEISTAPAKLHVLRTNSISSLLKGMKLKRLHKPPAHRISKPEAL